MPQMKPSTRRVIRDYGITILVAISVALVIRAYIIEAYRISNMAMHPAMRTGNVLFIAKWPYLGQKKTPARGDVVIFSSETDYIRRVIGIPGDTVAMKNGQMILNGRNLASTSNSPLNSDLCHLESLPETKPYRACLTAELPKDLESESIPNDSVFVISDWRSNEILDQKKTKSWGRIPISSIRGEAFWIWN